MAREILQSTGILEHVLPAATSILYIFHSLVSWAWRQDAVHNICVACAGCVFAFFERDVLGPVGNFSGCIVVTVEQIN